MRLNRKRRTASFLLCIYMLSAFLSVSALAEEADNGSICFAAVSESELSVDALSDDVVVGSRLYDLFFKEEKREVRSLIPGGEVFGIKMKQKFVTVTESTGVPGLRRGDLILSINGEEIKSAARAAELIKNSGGESLTIKALHGGEEIRIEVRPTSVDGEYKLGLSLRDGALGIGTVTYINPETGDFGGLGHGICDSETGAVIDMETGDITGVVLGGVHRGESGKPGELTGVLTDKDLGDLYTNSECGVFGKLDPEDIKNADPIPIGRREEVREGEATIISTVKNGKQCEYKIEIFGIDRSSEGSKSFRIKVTDPTLKALTGGIVRGM